MHANMITLHHSLHGLQLSCVYACLPIVAMETTLMQVFPPSIPPPSLQGGVLGTSGELSR